MASINICSTFKAVKQYIPNITRKRTAKSREIKSILQEIYLLVRYYQPSLIRCCQLSRSYLHDTFTPNVQQQKKATKDNISSHESNLFKCACGFENVVHFQNFCNIEDFIYTYKQSFSLSAYPQDLATAENSPQKIVTFLKDRVFSKHQCL